MSDDLPNQNNPSNPGGVNPPQAPASNPLNTPNSPAVSPNDSNTVDPVQSWVAQHEQRDSSGKFVKSDHLTNGQSLPTSQTSPNPSNSSSLPPPVSFTENTKYSEKNDPPLVDLKVTNPVTYFKKWVYKFLKNQDIDIRLKIKPFATIGLILAFTTVSGVSFNIGRMFFPNSSPILHRSITLQGEVQKSESGQYYLALPDNTLWTLKPKTTNINLSNVVNKQVLVKGNMTAEANVVEVAEVIAFDKPAPITPNNPIPATGSSQQNP